MHATAPGKYVVPIPIMHGSFDDDGGRDDTVGSSRIMLELI